MSDEGPDDLDRCLAEQMQDPAFAGAYHDAGARRDLIRRLTSYRKQAALSQQEVAAAMGTTQSAVSDFEGGATDPHLSTYQRYARAIGGRITYRFEPPRPESEPPVDPDAHVRSRTSTDRDGHLRCRCSCGWAGSPWHRDDMFPDYESGPDCAWSGRQMLMREWEEHVRSATS